MRCPKCNAACEPEDLDKPADFYYCECGHSWMDEIGWAERKACHADYLKKQRKEEM